MSNKDRDYLCWLAGYYEGEGSCGFYPKLRDGQGKFVISISQKERESLDGIKEFLGYGNISASRAETIYKCYRWEATMLRAVDFLSQIMPFMRTERKKAQAIKAITNYMSRSPRARRKYNLKSAIAHTRTRDNTGKFISKDKLNR